jgi:hypothetical protein
MKVQADGRVFDDDFVGTGIRQRRVFQLHDLRTAGLVDDDPLGGCRHDGLLSADVRRCRRQDAALTGLG